MRISLLLSYEMSLKQWEQAGLFDREISLYKALSENGIEVDLITYGDHSDNAFASRLPEINIIPLSARLKRPSASRVKSFTSLLIPWQLRDILRKTNIVKTNQMSGSWVAIMAKLLLRKKLIVRCGYELYRFYELERSVSRFKLFRYYWLEKIAYTLADKIILTTDEMKTYVEQTFFGGDKKPKIAVLPNYIRTEMFAPARKVDVVRDRVLFVGRLSREKNLHALIEALSNTVYGLDIVGKGELQNVLQRQAHAKGVSVRFLGTIPNNQLPEIMNNYAVFALVSFHEGNPKTLLEAMSCEMCIVATNVEGIGNIIKNGENGILCETDAESICVSIKRAFEDAAFRVRLGREARKYVKAHHDFNLLVKKEIALYTGLVGVR